jgi:pyruvate formate lyase activating enzyme
MLHCDFCHNWQTSQARLARDQDIVAYTPQQVVDYALRHDIGVLSWTYNDPVVWHEFVVDTAKLARRHGLKNLYKSAFYIGPRAIDELLDVIDIFSLSLKSMNPEHYRKFCGGLLQPVLDGIVRVYAAKTAHLELSNLCVTGRNDTLEEALPVARWMLDHLDADVPLHYVRFHPDYKYTHVERTSVPFLEEARRAAIAAGLRYVYVGNVYDTGSVNTYCPRCNELLVRRYGLAATVHLDGNRCPSCGNATPIVAWTPPASRAEGRDAATMLLRHRFRGAVQSIHIEQALESPVHYQFIDEHGQPVGERATSSCKRFMISKAYPTAVGVDVMHVPGIVPRVYEVFDRAHFPTVDLATARAETDRRPLPHCEKAQR